MPELAVQEDILIVNGIGVRLQPLTFLQGYFVQHVPDLVGVARMINVPNCAWNCVTLSQPLSCQDITVGFFDAPQTLSDVLVPVAVFRDACVDHDVASIGHIDVEVGRAGVWVECVAVSDVHLRSEIRPHEKIRHARGQVQTAITTRVVRQGDVVHEVGETSGETVGKIVVRRPILELHEHRVSHLVRHPFGELIKAVPEHLEGHVWNDLVGPGVDDVMADMAELAAEQFRRPEIFREVL